LSDWTVDSLKEHLDALRADDKAALAAALVAVEQSNMVTAVENLAWRKQQNEWRGALQDRERTAAAAFEKYATKDALEAAMKAVQAQVEDLKAWHNQSQGTARGVASLRSALFTVCGLVLSALAIGVTVILAHG
jgi:hypothetical protein